MLNENDFIHLISSRHSVRAFKEAPIQKDKINAIADASTRGPSAGNLQSYQTFVIAKKTEKEKLAEAAHGQGYIAEAPTVMVFCADPKRCGIEYGLRGEELFCVQDATIACTYAQIAAHSTGLSSVWIGSFDEDKVSDILKLNNMRPVAILPIGFPDETPENTTRRSLDEVIRWV